MRIAVASLAALAFSLPALGTDSWDIEEEVNTRAWRSASIQWAQSLVSNPPSAQYLQENVVPPPREMWCAPNGWEQRCDAWDFSMEQWLHHFLDIPYDEPLPVEIPAFPKECSSTCDTW